MKIVKAFFGTVVKVSPYDDENITLSVENNTHHEFKRATLNVDMAHDLMYALAEAVGWPPEPELPVFAEGDRVQVLKDPTWGGPTVSVPDYTPAEFSLLPGKIGVIEYGPDGNGDYSVEIDGDSWRVFAGSLCPAPAPRFTFGQLVTTAKGEEAVVIIPLPDSNGVVKIAFDDGETFYARPEDLTPR